MKKNTGNRPRAAHSGTNDQQRGEEPALAANDQAADSTRADPARPRRKLFGLGLQWVTSLKRRRKELFWAWIAYQTIKGILTTSLLWVPLLFWWIDKS